MDNSEKDCAFGANLNQTPERRSRTPDYSPVYTPAFCGPDPSDPLDRRGAGNQGGIEKMGEECKHIPLNPWPFPPPTGAERGGFRGIFLLGCAPCSFVPRPPSFLVEAAPLGAAPRWPPTLQGPAMLKRLGVGAWRLAGRYATGALGSAVPLARGAPPPLDLGPTPPSQALGSPGSILLVSHSLLR